MREWPIGCWLLGSGPKRRGRAVLSADHRRRLEHNRTEFIATFGTNPEAVLFIESDGKIWNYAAGRLSSAQTISLSIDRKTSWEGAPVRYSVKSPYTASNAVAEIPGLAPDGSELEQ
jgi:hypothetical protein